MDVGAIVGIVGVSIAVVGGVAVWAVRVSKGETASAKVDRLERDFIAKSAALERDLAEFKVTVSREYATAAMVTAVEKAVTDAFNRLSDRIDRLLENRH
jgi:hypothetical protein